MKVITFATGALIIASLSGSALAADKPTPSTYAGSVATSTLNRELQKARTDGPPRMASHYRGVPFVRERLSMSSVATRVGFRGLGVEWSKSTSNGTTERRRVARVIGRGWMTEKSTNPDGATTTEKFFQHMKFWSGEHRWTLRSTSTQPLGHGAVLHTSTKAEGARNGGTLIGLWTNERTGVWADGQSTATVSVRGGREEHVSYATAAKTGNQPVVTTESGRATAILRR